MEALEMIFESGFEFKKRLYIANYRLGLLSRSNPMSETISLYNSNNAEMEPVMWFSG